MEIVFFFVAMLKNDQISYLDKGPFINFSDADTAKKDNEINSPCYGSCSWGVVEAAVGATLINIYE